MFFICWNRVGCASNGASAMAMMLDEESVRSMAMTLEDSMASGGGACADARALVKIKTKPR